MALEEHLERPVHPQEMIATESQLFSGYLIIEGHECYFLCDRYGGWSVHSSFPAAKVTGLEATSSFASGDYEVRALVEGKLYRFGDLERDSAQQLVKVIELVGGERAEKRASRHAPVTRKRLEFSATLSARPSYSMDEGDAASIAEVSPRVARSTQRRPPPPPRRAPPPPAPAGFAFSKPVSKGFAVAAEVDDDDDESIFAGHDDEHEECDDSFAFPDDDDDEDDEDDDEGELDEDEFQEYLDGLEKAAGGAQSPAGTARKKTPKKGSAVKPATTLRPIVRGFAAAFIYAFFTNLVGAGALDEVVDEVMREPELAPYVWSVVAWCLIALPGGLISMSFGRTVMMAFAGVGAGVAATSLFMNMPMIPPAVVGTVGWLIVGWLAVLSRSGSSALLKAGAITVVMAILSEDMASGGTAAGALQCGLFWLMHSFWERYDLNAAAKKAAA